MGEMGKNPKACLIYLGPVGRGGCRKQQHLEWSFGKDGERK